MYINRIQLKKRTKNTWSRIISFEFDSKISSRVVDEFVLFNNSKRIFSNWKNELLENMRDDFLHERELFLDYLRSNFLIDWLRSNFLITWLRDNFLIKCELFFDWSRENFLVERE
jgi:hypothetical protein